MCPATLGPVQNAKPSGFSCYEPALANLKTLDSKLWDPKRLPHPNTCIFNKSRSLKRCKGT